ncbi:MAG TPA: hypothetical protein VNO21_08800 [Polyangiaceae bacterium]|nr:hypothetical protein [Polyangiaceae bacterium]
MEQFDQRNGKEGLVVRGNLETALHLCQGFWETTKLIEDFGAM